MTKQIESDYDKKYDILLIKIKDREYDISKQYGDLVIDFDKHDKVSAIQIFGIKELLK